MKFLQEWNANFHHNEIPISTIMKFQFLLEWNSHSYRNEIPKPTRLKFQFLPDWYSNSHQNEITFLIRFYRNVLTFRFWFCRNEIPILTRMKFQFLPEWNHIPNQNLQENTDIPILILSEWNPNCHQNEITFRPEWNHIPNQILLECTDIPIPILSEWNPNCHQNEITFLIIFCRNGNGNLVTFRHIGIGMWLYSDMIKKEFVFNSVKIIIVSRQIPPQLCQNFHAFLLWPIRISLHSGFDRSVSEFQTLCSINQSFPHGFFPRHLIDYYVRKTSSCPWAGLCLIAKNKSQSWFVFQIQGSSKLSKKPSKSLK